MPSQPDPLGSTAVRHLALQIQLLVCCSIMCRLQRTQIPLLMSNEPSCRQVLGTQFGLVLVCCEMSRHLTCFHQFAHEHLCHASHNCYHWYRHIVTCDGLKNLHNQLSTGGSPAFSSQRMHAYPLDLELVNGRASKRLVSVQLLFCHEFHDDSVPDMPFCLTQASSQSQFTTASFISVRLFGTLT